MSLTNVTLMKGQKYFITTLDTAVVENSGVSNENSSGDGRSAVSWIMFIGDTQRWEEWEQQPQSHTC